MLYKNPIMIRQLVLVYSNNFLQKMVEGYSDYQENPGIDFINPLS